MIPVDISCNGYVDSNFPNLRNQIKWPDLPYDPDLSSGSNKPFENIDEMSQVEEKKVTNFNPQLNFDPMSGKKLQSLSKAEGSRFLSHGKDGIDKADDERNPGDIPLVAKDSEIVVDGCEDFPVGAEEDCGAEDNIPVTNPAAETGESEVEAGNQQLNLKSASLSLHSKESLDTATQVTEIESLGTETSEDKDYSKPKPNEEKEGLSETDVAGDPEESKLDAEDLDIHIEAKVSEAEEDGTPVAHPAAETGDANEVKAGNLELEISTVKEAFSETRKESSDVQSSKKDDDSTANAHEEKDSRTDDLGVSSINVKSH